MKTKNRQKGSHIASEISGIPNSIPDDDLENTI